MFSEFFDSAIGSASTAVCGRDHSPRVGCFGSRRRSVEAGKYRGGRDEDGNSNDDAGWNAETTEMAAVVTTNNNMRVAIVIPEINSLIAESLGGIVSPLCSRRYGY